MALACGACGDRHAADRAGSEPARRRTETLARTRVWSAPRVPPARADFSVNPPGPGTVDAGADVDCTFVVQPIGGTTPKFFCALADGDRVKVKYSSNEIPAQVAASRLLTALGFFTDRLLRVRSVRCRGCPPFPAQALECLQAGGTAGACLQGASATTVRSFELAGIERPFEGKDVSGIGESGWAFYELNAIDARAGGSSRAEVDALRIAAALLAHWDNKSENQRLVCASGAMVRDGTCRTPLAVLHDLGATFGPLKIDLVNWRTLPLFADARACRISMATLPYSGGTFEEARISEEGRQLALGLLRPLTAAQLNTLFEASGVTAFAHVLADAQRPQAWTDVFLAKVAQLEAAGPCPSAASLRPQRDRD